MMRNKRSGSGQTVPNSALQQKQREQEGNNTSTADDSTSDAQNSCAAAESSFSSPLTSTSKRPADTMFTSASFNATSTELNGSGESYSASSIASKPSSIGSTLLVEIKEGAERLAKELDDYLSKDSNTKNPTRKEPLSDEAVADLQLATARKLREVSTSTCPYNIFKFGPIKFRRMKIHVFILHNMTSSWHTFLQNHTSLSFIHSFIHHAHYEYHETPRISQ
jgi:hypothetical protein